ncbi:MAG: SusC/RagA family TonB-linked outer membrane protein [Fidelibacterota bacterium]
MKTNTIFRLAVGLLVSIQVARADRQVTGQVTVEETGEPLVGAQVLVKGQLVGTTTDMVGTYRLVIPDEEITLSFTFIGYKSEDVAVAPGVEVVDVSMEVDVLKYSEVVVTGLASSVKRKNLANAVATVSGDELIPAPAQTLDGALSGKFAGINVRQNTGAPGGGMNVNLRGVSTIQGNTQPIYVIDGVIINNFANQSGIDVVTKATGAGSARPQGQPTNRISDINPNDIENIEVLKGASAAALYGSKASNGVIIINTKRGMGGKTRFSFSQKVGQRSLLKKMGHRVFSYEEAADQYGGDLSSLGLSSEGLSAFKSFKSEVGADSVSKMTGAELDALFGSFWLNRNIDYEEELYSSGTGDLVETVVSAVGGTERTQFYISGQHMDEAGTIVNTGFERWSGRLNINHRFSDRARVKLSTNLLRTDANRGVTGNDNTNITYGFSIGFTPSFIDIRAKDGEYPDHPNNPSNPLHTARVFTNRELTNRAIGSLEFNYTLFKRQTMSLAWITSGGADFYAQENKVFSPPELQYEKTSSTPGQSVNTTANNLNTNLYTNLIHRLILPGNINLTTTAGLQYETQDWDQVFVHAKGMVVGQTNVDQASSADVYQTRRMQQDRGFFVQEEINIRDQINVAFGMRGDRSSTLGDTEKWFTYPKFSVSYQAGALGGFFDNFKPRLAWGQTGNLPSATAKFTSLIPTNIGGISGLSPSGILGNPDIEPERTTELEYGVDFSFLKGLGSVEFTLYQQTIEDLILEVDQASSSGAASQWMNAAEMKTSGTELSLLLNPIRTPALDWVSRVNFYKTSSEITKLIVDPFNMGGFATFLGTYRIEEGWSPTAIVGSEMQYTYENGKLVPVYKVYKGLGDPDALDAADSVHQHVKLGDETPDFQMSFNNSIRIGDFSLQFLVDWKKGGHVINLAKLIYDLGATTADYEDDVKFTFRPSEGFDTSDGKDSTSTMQGGPGRLTVLSLMTRPYVEDGSYVKLREVSLFYHFDRRMIESLFRGSISSLRLGITGRNLAWWTNYTGLDPEVSQFGNIAIGGSVDTNPFPSSRSVYFTISLGI